MSDQKEQKEIKKRFKYEVQLFCNPVVADEFEEALDKLFRSFEKKIYNGFIRIEVDEFVGIHAPGNVQMIEQIWAILSEDANGEGIAGTFTSAGFTPLVAGNEKNANLLLQLASKMKDHAPSTKLKFVKFTKKELVREL